MEGQGKGPGPGDRRFGGDLPGVPLDRDQLVPHDHNFTMKISSLRAFTTRGCRLRLRLIVLTVIACGAMLATGALDSVAAPVGPTARAAAELASLARSQHGLATRAHAAAKTRQCKVKYRLNGKLVVFKQRLFVYRYVLVHGRRVRVRRSVLAPIYAKCTPPPCLKTHRVKVFRYINVNGKRKRVSRTVVLPLTRVVISSVKVRRNGHLVTVKKRSRKYVIAACASVSGTQTLGTPVTISIDPGSYTLLDFVAFQRQAALSGTLHGFIVGGLQLGSTNLINLTSGKISVAQTPIFIDDSCNGQVTAAIRTGTPTTISLDPTLQSTSTLGADGTITSIVHVVIDLPLELRNGDLGCNNPYLTTGYDEEKATFFLIGKFTGLTGDKLTSAPQDIQFGACLSLGPETSPCGGFAIPIDVLVSNHLIVDINVGS